MFGFLNLDKPLGLTSRRAVDKIQRQVRPHKLGHTGTLDPLATGVLPLAIGPATRLTRFLLEMPKTYRGTYRLGLSSNTDDLEGELTEVGGAERVTRSGLESVLDGFRGPIEQVPPEYSAVKVDGRRAYRLARKGQAVQLQPRRVQIHRLELLRFEPPEFELLVECSSGTYLRSLGRDIGQRLQTAAVMTRLVRTTVGPFRLDQALPLEQIETDGVAAHLIPPQSALPQIPSYSIPAEWVDRLAVGGLIATREMDRPPNDARRLLAIDPQGRLVAILYRYRPDFFKPELNFSTYHDSKNRDQ